jgi:hypothetical protein
MEPANLRDRPGHLKGRLAQRVQMVRPPRSPVQPDQLVRLPLLQDHRETLDQLVRVVRPVQLLRLRGQQEPAVVDQLDPLVHKEKLGLPAPRVQQEPRVQLVQREARAQLDPPEQRVRLLDPQARQGRPDPPEQPARADPREHMVRLEPRVAMDPRGPRVLVPQVPRVQLPPQRDLPDPLVRRAESVATTRPWLAIP